ncbi:hypothetical protein NR798_37535 [Archangium gephyra]|uniref:hypothetical protein n=1 Tax=Archangium gephyra TaxID=48 RepID=UPI0035D49652
MKTMMGVLAFAVLLVSGAASAQEPVEVSFIDNGGIIYKVNPTGFTINYPYGSFQTDGYVLPRDSRIRNGCFLTTPWLPVSHADGQALGFPQLTLEWWGDLHPVQQPDQTLLRLQLEVKKPDGSVYQMRSYVHTGLLTLQPRAYYPDGWVTYYGRMDNPLPSGEEKNFGSIAVSELDEVRYTLCDLYGGGKLTVRGLKVMSYPVF